MGLTQDDFIWETSDVYHSKAQDYLSSHQLMSYIKSPIGYIRRKQQPPADSSSFFLGRAVHTMILEGGEVFFKQYVIGGPVNEKTGKPYGTNTIKYQEWLDNLAVQNKEGVSETDFLTIETAENCVHSHAIANDLLDYGFPEATVRATYNGIECQIRIDWYNFKKQCIVDLKTTRNIEKFPYDFRDYLYANQLSFYQNVFNCRFGFYPEVYIIAAEIAEPFRVGVFKITDGTLEDAREVNEGNMVKFMESKRSGRYPTLYEDLRVL